MQHLSRNKRPFIGHLHRPSFRISGPKQPQLAHTGQELTPRSCKVTAAVTLRMRVIKERKEGREKKGKGSKGGKKGRKEERGGGRKKETKANKINEGRSKVFF